MADIKVIINGQIVELPPQGLNLPLTYSLKDRNGITINTGSRSEYAFELPATKHNDSIFNQFYDPAIYTINQQVFLPASIEVDGIPFFNGKCQLQSVNLRQDQYIWQGKSYKVAFYGNNADWAIQIGDLLLKDLPYTDHVYSYTDCLNYWYVTYPAFDFKYLPIKLKDYTTFGQLDAFEDSHLALFIAGLIDKIFNSIGYTVNSSFFATDFFKKLILPIPLLNRYLQEDYGADYLNIAVNELAVPYTFPGGQIIYTNQTSTPLVGPNPYNTGTGIYTAPTTGFYLIKFTADIYNYTASGQADFFYAINTPPIILLGSPTVTADTIYYFEQVIQLNAGDNLYFGFGGTFGGADANYYLEILGEAELTDGFQLNPKFVIDKSWKAIDLIKGLAHAFNLVFETNEGSRSVQIEPADDYLIESKAPNYRNLKTGFYTDQKTVNLTPYVDLSKGGELTNDTKILNQLRLKWKDDSNDPTVENLNANQNLGILEARFNFPVSRYKEGETIIENPFFAPTLVLADNEIRQADSTRTPMIPIVWSVNYLETSTSSEAVTQMLPRLLVSDDTLNIIPLIPNGLINVFDGVGVTPYAAPLNYMVDYNDLNGYQTSLSFGDETINGFPIAGLLKRFYLSEMVRLQGGKYLEIFLLWDVVMLNNLTFRDKITINNNLYILQEINAFNVAKNESTKTYFVLDNKEVGADGSIRSTVLTAKINT